VRSKVTPGGRDGPEDYEDTAMQGSSTRLRERLTAPAAALVDERSGRDLPGGSLLLAGLLGALIALPACPPDFALDDFVYLCEGELCRLADLPPRCDRVEPPDLVTSPDQQDAFIFVSLMHPPAPTQVAREQAIQLAVQQANQEGGVDGRRVGVIFCDIEEDPSFDGRTRAEAAIDVVEHLATHAGVRAVVGPSASSDVAALFNAVRERDVLIISPSATSVALTDIDVTNPTDERPGLLWRTAPPDSLQAAVIAADLADRGVSEVVAIHATGAYGEGLARELDRRFGGTVHLRPFGNSAARDQQVNGTPLDTEVLFVSSFVEDNVAFFNLFASRGPEAGVFLPDSAASASFLTGTAGASAHYERVRGTRPATPSGFVYDSFASAFSGAFGRNPGDFSFTAHTYDAAWMVIYAMAWAHFNEDGLSGTHLARGLRRLSAGREFEVRPGDFQGIVQSFREGVGVDIVGTSGSLDYDLAVEETTGPIELWRIDPATNAFESIRVVEP